MHPALNRNLFFVKEHVRMFRASNQYDVLDPQSGELVLQSREEKLGLLTKLLRFTDYKRMTPFNAVVRAPDGRQVLRVSRGVTLFRSRVKVFDENDRHIGGFKQRLFSIGGKFEVLDSADRPLCMLVGKWTSWDFRFMSGEVEFARVTKKWAGLGKELFTSADNYMLVVSEQVPADNPVRQLILAAVMCIDLVLKE